MTVVVCCQIFDSKSVAPSSCNFWQKLRRNFEGKKTFQKDAWKTTDAAVAGVPHAAHQRNF